MPAFSISFGRHAEIVASSSPGFGRSPRPEDFDTVYPANDCLRRDLALRPGVREGRQSVPAAVTLRIRRTVGYESRAVKL